MQPSLPLWFQRLPDDLRRRLELTEAAAREALVDAHAQQALNLVTVFSSRLPFDEAVERYVDVMGLGGEEAEIVQTRALVSLAEGDVEAELARDRQRGGWGLDWRYATPLGAVRFVRRALRRNAEEDLWMELSAARAEEAILRVHIKHALLFVEILQEYAPPTRAVSLYLDQMEVPASRVRSVYQRVLARVAETELPRPVQPKREEPAPPPAPPARRPRR